MVSEFLIEHCTPFFAACKEVFEKFFRNFTRKYKRAGKLAQSGVQKPENRRPQRQQKAAERMKIPPRAQRRRRKRKQPQLPAPEIKRKEQQRREKSDSEQPVRRPARARPSPSEGPYAIIHGGKSHPKQRREQRLRRLQRNRQLHQPNSRAKKPPAGASSS